jgi:hypothetical protein
VTSGRAGPPPRWSRRRQAHRLGTAALLLAISGLTVACAGRPADPPATAVPSPTATAPSPTATRTATARPTPTIDPPATATGTATATPSPSPPVARASAAARVWGLQLALDELPEHHAAEMQLEVPRAKAAGLNSVRTLLQWRSLEPQNTTPDRYDWAEPDRRLADYAAAGLDTVVMLVSYPAWATVYACGYDLQPGMEAEWRQFVRAAAERYGRPPYRVVAWEVGNEVDGKTTLSEEDRQRPPEWGGNQPTIPFGGCWGDRAPRYVDFLRAAHEEIRAADPEALITFGNLAYAFNVPTFHVDFLEQFLAAGGGPYFDYLGYHWFPNLGDQPSGPEKVRMLVETMARHGLRKPLWLTETYRLTFPAVDWSPKLQVEFLTKELVEVLAAPQIARVYWYGWVDFPLDYKKSPEDADRGIVTRDHVPKPALQVLPHTVRVTTGRPEDISTEAVVAFRFSAPGAGGEHVVAWSRSGQPAPFSLPARPGEQALVTRFPPDALLAGSPPLQETVTAQDGVFRFEAGTDPLFIALQAP